MFYPSQKNIIGFLKGFISFNFSSQKLCTEIKIDTLDSHLANEKRWTHPEDRLDEMIIPVAASLLFIDCLGLFGCDAELLHG